MIIKVSKCNQCTKKLVSLKHGVRAINQTENSTDHFCQDTRQNALAAFTNLGHVTHFYCLDPLSI